MAFLQGVNDSPAWQRPLRRSPASLPVHLGKPMTRAEAEALRAEASRVREESSEERLFPTSYVTLKTDGRRAFLVVFPDLDVVLADRSLTLRHFDQKAKTGPAILDGEYVPGPAPHFEVFDVVMTPDDRELLDEPALDARLASAKRFIQAETAGNFAWRIGDMAVAMKSFYGLGDTGTLLEQMVWNPETQAWMFFGPTRQCIKVDGLVFTPRLRRSYLDLIRNKTLKYKPSDVQTVDFLVRGSSAPGRQKIFVASDGDSLLSVGTIPDAGLSENSIVECSFDKASGSWIPLQTRVDKVRPNYITVMLSVMSALAEDFTAKELAGIFSPPFVPAGFAARASAGALAHRRRLVAELTGSFGMSAAKVSADLQLPGTGIRLAIIVPYRPNPLQHRHEQLVAFLKYMTGSRAKGFVDHLKVDVVEIFVVEQLVKPGQKFNRGALLNIGAKRAISAGYNVLCFHDMDLLPQASIQSWYEKLPSPAPIHLAAAWGRYTYPDYLGGVLSILDVEFVATNGFPNDAWGWGGEDDAFKRRLGYACVPPPVKPDVTNGYIDLEDDPAIGSEIRSSLKIDEGGRTELRNMTRREGLAKEKKTWRINGYAQLVLMPKSKDAGTGIGLFPKTSFYAVPVASRMQNKTRVTIYDLQ